MDETFACFKSQTTKYTNPAQLHSSLSTSEVNLRLINVNPRLSDVQCQSKMLIRRGRQNLIDVNHVDYIRHQQVLKIAGTENMLKKNTKRTNLKRPPSRRGLICNKARGWFFHILSGAGVQTSKGGQFALEKFPKRWTTLLNSP